MLVSSTKPRTMTGTYSCKDPWGGVVQSDSDISGGGQDRPQSARKRRDQHSRGRTRAPLVNYVSSQQGRLDSAFGIDNSHTVSTPYPHPKPSLRSLHALIA